MSWYKGKAAVPYFTTEDGRHGQWPPGMYPTTLAQLIFGTEHTRSQAEAVRRACQTAAARGLIRPLRSGFSGIGAWSYGAAELLAPVESIPPRYITRTPRLPAGEYSQRLSDGSNADRAKDNTYRPRCLWVVDYGSRPGQCRNRVTDGGAYCTFHRKMAAGDNLLADPGRRPLSGGD